MTRTKIERWNQKQEPTEQSIRALLAGEGLQPYRWSNGPGDFYSAHTHPYHKVVYVISGSITFGLPQEGKRVTLHAGDCLELPMETPHNAIVGPEGVACLEAHHP